jgi:hypothetical protein
MKQINLYQAAFRPPSILLPARKLAISGGVFVLGLLALYAWNDWQLRQLHQQVAQIEQRADAVMRQVLASAPAPQQSDASIAIQAQSLEARVRALQLAQDAISSGAVGSATGYAAQFRSLARTTHAGAWLTGVTVSDNGRALDLQGRALSGAAAAGLISNLRREPVFGGLSFAGLQISQPEQKAGTLGKPDITPAPASFLVFSLAARLADASDAPGQQPGNQSGNSP